MLVIKDQSSVNIPGNTNSMEDSSNYSNYIMASNNSASKASYPEQRRHKSNILTPLQPTLQAAVSAKK